MPIPETDTVAVVIAESRGEDEADRLYTARDQLRTKGWTAMCIVSTNNGYSYLIVDCQINDVPDKVKEARAAVAWLWDD